MIRSFFRRGLRLGAVIGAILFLVQVFLRRQPTQHPADTAPAPPPKPEPRPVEPAATGAAATSPAASTATGNGSTTASRSEVAPEAPVATKPKPKPKAKPKSKPKKGKATVATDVPAWVAPVEGAIPETHPVKVKVSSGIYHLPGMMNYDRTSPDRCYRDAASAEADGFRPARR